MGTFVDEWVPTHVEVEKVNEKLPSEVLELFNKLDNGCLLGACCSEPGHPELWRLKKEFASLMERAK